MMINSHQITFDGEVLQRGFWLYMVEIRCVGKKYVYIGRTGDSSSPNAASPFLRIGQHLDFGDNARSNSLAKRLKEQKIDPTRSRFRILALGPFFPEQESFEAHKPYRDQMATLEYEIAEYLREKKISVLGVHQKGISVQTDVLGEVKSKVLEFLSNETR
jgi:hypothetical protein